MTSFGGVIECRYWPRCYWPEGAWGDGHNDGHGSGLEPIWRQVLDPGSLLAETPGIIGFANHGGFQVWTRDSMYEGHAISPIFQTLNQAIVALELLQ